jgi:radical SAM superfamily enzyme YgiQ (UPF0313 family)
VTLLADYRIPALYGTRPRVPPDETTSIYLQPSVGCPHPVCTFCALHKEPFRARMPGEFKDHVARVREALGEGGRFRPRIFFGDANALRVPPGDLASMIAAALESFPSRPVHAYADARLAADAALDDLRRLSDAGLRRVTIGLETGCETLYRSLGKRGTLDDLRSSVRRLKEARVGVGLTVLLGLGGKSFRQRHAADTIAFLRGLKLGAPDVVYLLLYRPERATPYAAAASAEPDLRATDEEFRIQERAFRENVEDDLLRRGARLISGELGPVGL